MAVFNPELTSRLVKMDGLRQREIFLGIANKTNSSREISPRLESCDATYEFDTTYKMSQDYVTPMPYQRTACEVNAVGTQLFDVRVSWPVRNEFAETFNYYMLELVRACQSALCTRTRRVAERTLL